MREDCDCDSIFKTVGHVALGAYVNWCYNWAILTPLHTSACANSVSMQVNWDEMPVAIITGSSVQLQLGYAV